MKLTIALFGVCCLGTAWAGPEHRGDATHYLVLNEDGYYLPVVWFARSGELIVFSISDPATMPYSAFQPSQHNSRANAAAVASESMSASDAAVGGGSSKSDDGARWLGVPSSTVSAWFRDADVVDSIEYEVTDTFADHERGLFVLRGKPRVALARGVWRDPDLILLDEPSAALDAAQLAEVKALIERLQTP